MSTPSVRQQLEDMKRNGMKLTPMRRSPMRRKPAVDVVESFVLEAVDGKRWRWPHHYMLESDWDDTLVDWANAWRKKLGDKRYVKAFHVTSKIVTEKGWFDFVWMGPAGVLFTEHKVRYQDGKANQLSPWQKDFFAEAHGAGADARAWLWPDDAEDAWTTLTGRPWAECPYAREVS